MATWNAALNLLNEIVEWLKAHANEFGQEDRLQIVVGFPETVKWDNRQIIKCWLPASRLPDLHQLGF